MNKKTITYSMKTLDFKYHITKGQLKKGSTISKNIHPVSRVNEYRSNLLERKLLIDEGEYYILKNTINIGGLMAANLHSGTLVDVIESDNDLIINHRDSKTINDFAIDNVYSTDSEIRNNEYKDSLVLSDIYEIGLDFTPFNYHDPDTFSEIERFFLTC